MRIPVITRTYWENERIKANAVYFLLNPGINWGAAMKYGIIIKQPDCVPAIAVPIVHGSLEELKATGCSQCFNFDGYLIVADTSDVHC